MRGRSISIDWRRVALGVLAGVGALYVAAAAALFLFQRDMIYHPVGHAVAPDPGGPAIQVVEIVTADGERLVAWWLPPLEGRPTLLVFNGNGDSLALQTGRWRRIADAGAGFLAVAYRGYDGSTGRPSEAGLHEDARAAYDWLAMRVPSDDIVIHGFSLGSGVASYLATERDARALILEAPYTALVDVAAERLKLMPVRLLARDRFRTRDWIGEVRAPVLIVHGDADSVVPFAHGERIFAAAPSPKRFVRMEGADHNTLTRDGLYDHVWRFLGVPSETTTAYRGAAAPFEQTDIPSLTGAVPESAAGSGQDGAAPL